MNHTLFQQTITRYILALFLIICSQFIAFPASAWCLFGCVPIEVSFYDPKNDKGLVARFHNTSNKYLAVNVVLNNNTLKQKRSGYLEFSPDQAVELGWWMGWKFMSGETITISHEDYNTVVIKVP